MKLNMKGQIDDHYTARIVWATYWLRNIAYIINENATQLHIQRTCSQRTNHLNLNLHFILLHAMPANLLLLCMLQKLIQIGTLRLAFTTDRYNHKRQTFSRQLFACARYGAWCIEIKHELTTYIHELWLEKMAVPTFKFDLKFAVSR